MELTATQAMLNLDIKRNYARQQATMLIAELSRGGYIAERCQSEAIYHLTELFYKHGVEITTSEERKLLAFRDKL